MWLARNKHNGKVFIFYTKPIRDKFNGDWCTQLKNKKGDYAKSYHTKVGEITHYYFDNLKWEDEPIEVDFIPVNIQAEWLEDNQ